MSNEGNPIAAIRDVITEHRRNEKDTSVAAVSIANIMVMCGISLETVVELLANGSQELGREIEFNYLTSEVLDDTFRELREFELELITLQVIKIADKEVDRTAKERVIINYIHRAICIMFASRDTFTLPDHLLKKIRLLTKKVLGSPIDQEMRATVRREVEAIAVLAKR